MSTTTNHTIWVTYHGEDMTLDEATALIVAEGQDEIADEAAAREDEDGWS